MRIPIKEVLQQRPAFNHFTAQTPVNRKVTGTVFGNPFTSQHTSHKNYRMVVHGLANGHFNPNTQTEVSQEKSEYLWSKLSHLFNPDFSLPTTNISTSLTDTQHPCFYGYVGFALLIPEVRIIVSSPNMVGARNWNITSLREISENIPKMNYDSLLSQTTQCNEAIPISQKDQPVGEPLTIETVWILKDKNGRDYEDLKGWWLKEFYQKKILKDSPNAKFIKLHPPTLQAQSVLSNNLPYIEDGNQKEDTFLTDKIDKNDDNNISLYYHGKHYQLLHPDTSKSFIRRNMGDVSAIMNEDELNICLRFLRRNKISPEILSFIEKTYRKLEENYFQEHSLNQASISPEAFLGDWRVIYPQDRKAPLFMPKEELKKYNYLT